MRSINVQEANKLLGEVGLRIGSWDQVEAIKSKDLPSIEYWEKHHAPENAQELCSFAQYIAGWLSPGRWKIFQIDNSTALDFAQAEALTRLLKNAGRDYDLLTDRTFLFEFCENEERNQKQELLIADLIFMMLLWEAHAQFVSSTNAAADYLSIQDGFVYFCSGDEERVQKTPLEAFEKNKRGAPSWVLRILEAHDKS
jgi:hypothetical protein